MIRIAAAGDVHYDRRSQGRLLEHLQELKGRCDMLLLAGDLTQTGHIEEAEILARDIAQSPVPVVAVLGNHDYHLDHERAIERALAAAGVQVLDGNGVVLKVDACRVGVAGLKGFGGGFVGACGSDFGEPEMKSFIHHTKSQAQKLREALEKLEADFKIALLHYSPVAETLTGERREIFPFLGSYLLAEAIDLGKADLAFHGHAHKGSEKGCTLGGVPVRNVAQPVIRHAFNIYTLNKGGLVSGSSVNALGENAAENSKA
jgi:Icc-related predicted phosphoesterase